MASLQGKSLREFYKEVCVELKVTPNSQFSDMLPGNVGEPLLQEEINLSVNYVGDRGMTAVTKVLAVGCPNIKVLRLKDNGLRNKSVIELAECLRSHSKIELLDLSNNYISTGAGRALEKLLQENGHIRFLNVENTKIDAEIRLRIQDILKQRQ